MGIGIVCSSLFCWKFFIIKSFNIFQVKQSTLIHSNLSLQSLFILPNVIGSKIYIHTYMSLWHNEYDRRISKDKEISVNTVAPQFSNLNHSGKLFKKWLVRNPILLCWRVTDHRGISIKVLSNRELRPKVLLRQLRHFLCQRHGWEPNCLRTKTFKNPSMTAFERWKVAADLLETSSYNPSVNIWGCQWATKTSVPSESLGNIRHLGRRRRGTEQKAYPSQDVKLAFCILSLIDLMFILFGNCQRSTNLKVIRDFSERGSDIGLKNRGL